MSMTGPLNSAALLVSLVGSTLVVCTAAAALPALLLSQPRPRERPSPPQAPELEQVVARGAGGRWYLNQQPIAPERLARLLGEARVNDGGEVVLVVSRTLHLAEVSEGLAWLRQSSPLPVRLAPPLER
ncbi:MAG: hypothetical protein KFB97_06020 [Cyanobium sp. M30B3]|nr:MAG: hypothetical protein KFB97_06020 [Cyanobium sp. M30B3]